MRILDNSQYKCFMDCPRKWYTTYVDMVEPIPWTTMNDSALTLGSLVHAGLEHVLSDGKVYIDPAEIKKCNPTPQCLAEAMHLLTAYALEMTHEPYICSKIEESLFYEVSDKLTLMAKVDEYFELKDFMDLPTGHGEYITLDPGWWVREQKTKAQSISYDSFANRWTYDRQADFQTLCLSNHINTPANGVLINVIEKPKRYVPKRKCKGCKNILPFASYTIRSDGRYQCSICNYEQLLSPVKPDQITLKNPKFFRLYTRRSPGRLAQMVREVEQIANRMDRMEAEGIEAEPSRIMEGTCTHAFFGPCKFYPLCITEDGIPLDPHTHGKYRKADTKAYMGLNDKPKTEVSKLRGPKETNVPEVGGS